MKAFGSDEELTETRRQANGAVIESGVMTPISDEFFLQTSQSLSSSINPVMDVGSLAAQPAVCLRASICKGRPSPLRYEIST